MTKTELMAAIRRYGIRPDAYDLDGVGCSECYVLKHEDGAWAVFYSERGFRRALRWFDTEAAACEHMLQILLKDPITRRGGCK